MLSQDLLSQKEAERVVGISGMRFGQIHMGHIIQKKKQEKTLIDTVQKNWV